MRKEHLQAKFEERFRLASACFARGLSLQATADEIGISKTTAHRLHQRWHDSMAPALVAPPPGRQTPPPGPAQSTDKEVADPKVRRDIEALLAWAGKGNLADIIFSEVYRWTRETCPNSERRNRIFEAWNETQTYEKLMRDNLGYYQPENPKGEAVVVADSATPVEPEVKIMKVATEEEIFQARRWAEGVLYRYEVFRLRSDHGNLIAIARNEESLFSEEQVVEAQAFIDNPLLGKRPGE